LEFFTNIRLIYCLIKDLKNNLFLPMSIELMRKILVIIYSNYRVLIKTIMSLETQGFLLAHSIEIVENRQRDNLYENF